MTVLLHMDYITAMSTQHVAQAVLTDWSRRIRAIGEFWCCDCGFRCQPSPRCRAPF